MAVRAGSVLLVLLFLHTVTATAARADPISFLGSTPFKVLATGGDVSVYFLGSDAAADSMLFLSEPERAGMFFPNHSTPLGLSMSLGGYAAGTELVFGLHVFDTGDRFFTGPADRNPDGFLHARAVGWAASRLAPSPGVLIAFEDQFNGGDRDFNDFLFVVSNAALADVEPVPEPATLLLVGGGIAGLAARRRVRRSC